MSLDRTEQTKLQKDIDKIEVFLQQYSAYDVSRADPRAETGIIEVHEDFSMEDALAHFLARIRWILKALRTSMIIPNTDEVGVQYITVKVGFGPSIVASEVKKSFKRMKLEEHFRTYFSKQTDIREITGYRHFEANSSFLLQINYVD